MGFFSVAGQRLHGLLTIGDYTATAVEWLSTSIIGYGSGWILVEIFGPIFFTPSARQIPPTPTGLGSRVLAILVTFGEKWLPLTVAIAIALSTYFFSPAHDVRPYGLAWAVLWGIFAAYVIRKRGLYKLGRTAVIAIVFVPIVTGGIALQGASAAYKAIRSPQDAYILRRRIPF